MKKPIYSIVSVFCLLILCASLFKSMSGAAETHQSNRTWIILHGQLDKVTVDPQALAAFKNDTLYVTGLNPAEAPASDNGLHIIPTRIYHSEADIEHDIKSNSIPKYFKALLYDNEPWKLTPTVEKKNPVLFYKKGYEIAHSHGYQFIATPVPAALAPQVAPYADVVDVQAQHSQKSTSQYVNFIGPKVRAVKRANPNAIVLSGISTNPSVGDPTPRQLYYIAQATYGTYVQGWWLNIPNPGASCPRCNEQRPDIAIAFLRMLGPLSLPQASNTQPSQPTTTISKKSGNLTYKILLLLLSAGLAGFITWWILRVRYERSK